MPFIPFRDRQRYKDHVELLASVWRRDGQVPGELAYVVYYLARCCLGPSPRYEDYARVLGVLWTVLNELGRDLGRYEDQKKAKYPV